MTTETTTEGMPFREKFAYGFGDLASVPYWQTQHGLRLLVSVIPAVLGGLSILLMLGYPLEEDLVKKVGAELAARRKESGETV
jgi:Na+/melibiose symporter-like transporter